MITYHGYVITKHTDVNNWINVTPPPDPYNPLGLPPRTFQIDGSYSLNYIKRDFDCYFGMPTGNGDIRVNVTSYEQVYVTIKEGGVERTVPRWNITIDFPWWFSGNTVQLDYGKYIQGQLNKVSTQSQQLYHCYGMNLTDVYDMTRISDWFNSVDYCYAPDLIIPDTTSSTLCYNSSFNLDDDNYYHLIYTDINPAGGLKEYDLKLYKDDNRYLESWEGNYSARYMYINYGQFFGQSNVTYVKFIIGPYIKSLKACFYPCHYIETAIIEAPSGCYVTNMEDTFHTDGGALSSVVLPDTSHVTNMKGLFCNNWRDFEECPSFNTSNVTNIDHMFYNCAQLKEIPNLTFGKVVNADDAFNGTYNASTGILRAYNNLSSQTTPPSSHNYTFTDSGKDSVTGSAELAQIPNDWK